MGSICTTPITGPKAWLGAGLGADTSWIVTLTEAEIADLDRALIAARASGRALAEIDRASFPLNVLQPRLEQALVEMRDGRGFLVLRGLPVERYSDDEVGLIFWGLGRHLGTPLYQNPQGDLLGHVYDHGRTYGNFDDEPRPDGEWTPTALANWSSVVERRARLIFEDSKIGPSEAYGGTRRAT